MTDKMDSFRMAGAAIERAAGYKKGMAQVVNLVEAFQARGVTFGNMDGVAQGQFEK